MVQLQRRGFDLGSAPALPRPPMPSAHDVQQAWQADQAMMLPALVSNAIEQHAQAIQTSHHLMENVLKSGELASLLEQPAYIARIQNHFFVVATSPEEHDEQGIEKVYVDAFDANEDDIVAEELWCKASWLSFYDEDASLRFRFSWGMEGYEDVAADPLKQAWAGKLCDALFPESSIITENNTILRLLETILDEKPSFVERIVYFNAPQGGAQFHHDVERGHAGVVFAQLSGATCWLAIAKPKLMDEIMHFVQQAEHQETIKILFPQAADRKDFKQLCSQRDDLSAYMEEPDHSLIEALIDQCPAFIQQLIQHDYSHTLQAGDVLLLPQRDIDHCVWHSVFSLGENPGEALSFAVR